MKAIMIRFADDMVCLCRKGQGVQMYQALKKWLEHRGLKLNEEKTRIVNSQQESLEFLGFRLSRRKSWKGKQYTHVEPSPKSCNKLREAIGEETTKSTRWKSPEEVFSRVNQRVRGWSQYFHHGHSGKVFGKMQHYLETRMRGWLWNKHGRKLGGRKRSCSYQELHTHYGLIKLPLYAAWKYS